MRKLWYSPTLRSAIPAAAFGAQWGLAGLMYGMAVGWILRAALSLYVTSRHLRLPASIPVPAP